LPRLPAGEVLALHEGEIRALQTERDALAVLPGAHAGEVVGTRDAALEMEDVRQLDAGARHLVVTPVLVEPWDRYRGGAAVERILCAEGLQCWIGGRSARCGTRGHATGQRARGADRGEAHPCLQQIASRRSLIRMGIAHGTLLRDL